MYNIVEIIVLASSLSVVVVYPFNNIEKGSRGTVLLVMCWRSNPTRDHKLHLFRFLWRIVGYYEIYANGADFGTIFSCKNTSMTGSIVPINLSKIIAHTTPTSKTKIIIIKT